MITKEEGIYKLVYEYYETRIRFGHYSCGEKLPSIAKMCEAFSMAPLTIRSALRLLEKKGYIRIDARKTARVIYQPAKPGYRRYAAEYFVPRKEGILDLDSSGKLIFEPIWKMGMKRMSPEIWEEFVKDLGNPTADSLSLPVQFYILVYKSLGNALIPNFYWEVIRYICFPYLVKPERRGTEPLELSGTSREEIVEQLGRQFEAAYERAMRELLEFIEQTREEYGLEEAEPVPFQWNVYRQRPQLCYSLVSDIIRNIRAGVYPQGSYLPSLPKMAEQYSVSVSTVRRTLKVLQSLGVTHSYHGKGTQICKDIGPIDFKCTEIREGLRLHLESIQILAYTIRQVLCDTLESTSEADRTAFVRQLTDLREQGKSYLCFENCLGFIETHCRHLIVRECYRKLRELLAWGYPFTQYRLRNKSLNAEYAQLLGEAAGYLQTKDWRAFSDAWGIVMEQEVQKVQEIFGMLQIVD